MEYTLKNTGLGAGVVQAPCRVGLRVDFSNKERKATKNGIWGKKMKIS